MTFNIEIAKNNEYAKWDEIVSNSNQATVFHTWDWLNICNKYSDFNLIPLICYNNTEPVAIYPLFHLNKAGLKMVFSPPPHLGLLYLGPAYLNFDSLKQDKKESYHKGVLKAVDQYITEEIRANYINFSLSPVEPDPRPFKWRGYNVEPNYDYIFDLKAGTEALWMNLKKNARAEIKRMHKIGIVVDEGDRNDLQILYNMMVKRYSDQDKFVNLPLEYLLEIYDHFSDNIRIMVAKHDDEIITASVKIRFKNKELSWIGSPKPENFSPSPNTLITWEEIKEAASSGIDYYIQMGTAGNERLHNYFSKFNPDLRIRFNVKKTTLSSKILEYSYIKHFKPNFEKLQTYRHKI